MTTKTPASVFDEIWALARTEGDGQIGTGLSLLAERIGTGRAVRQFNTIRRWRENRTIPAERVLSVERVTGIPRHRLRPDLYPAPNRQTEAA